MTKAVSPIKVDFSEYCLGLSESKPHRESPIPMHNLLIQKLPVLQTLIEDAPQTSDQQWRIKKSFKLIAIDMNRAKRELSKKKVLKIVESKSPRTLPPLKHSVESAVVGVSLSRNQIKQITDSSFSILTKKRRYHQIP